ncbi:glycosyltransferase family 4 protein [Aurantiacibacter hainanensis]|uniref:glycosyltransferase family 4 protein n=1 Tax=Aurantiacibacter hainanensis TaxID=3076114 RepID=UPI0030C74E0B
MTRLAILASHPIQYYAPLFRELARRIDLTVFYAHNATAQDQARAGFGVGFTWDVDLLSGYDHVFLGNVSRKPGLGRFSGVDTPEIGQRLSEGRFDALLVMGWYLKSFIQGLVSAKLSGIPVMVRGDSHLDTPRNALKLMAKRVLYPRFLGQFDAALVVGKRNRAYWEYYGYPQNRMFDAPHCIDNAFFADLATQDARMMLRRDLGVPADAKLAMMAGKLIPLKRPVDLVEAVAKSRQDGVNAHVLVAGSGPLEEHVRARCSELGVPLHLLGFCNQTQMPAAYAAADVLVMCSESETWGLVVNEALASGTPALVSDVVGCAPDLLEALGPRAVFQLGDIDDLAAKLKNVFEAPPSDQEIIGAANRFDLGAVADRIVAAAKLQSKNSKCVGK